MVAAIWARSKRAKGRVANDRVLVDDIPLI
jgi:hypothetical protein